MLTTTTTHLHQHELLLLRLLGVLALVLRLSPSPWSMVVVLAPVHVAHTAGGIGRHEVLHPHVHAGGGYMTRCCGPHRHPVHVRGHPINRTYTRYT